MMNRSIRPMTRVVTAAAALACGVWSVPASACSAEPLLASMCIFAGNFAPRGWAFTHGQVLSIAQNTAVFALLGTTYGGNGQTTFALPDTRGRVVVGAGQGPGLSPYDLGQVGGSETATLNTNHLPAHSHGATTSVNVTSKARGNSATGNADGPGGNTWAARPRGGQYSTVAPDVDMKAGTIDVAATASTTVGITGGSQPFAIIQPYVTLNYIIALEGIFPARN